MIQPPRSRPHPMIDPETPMQERPSRTHCKVTCVIQATGESVDAELLDYTDRGFQVRCSKNLAVASRVMLAIPSCYPVEAVVRWALGARAGCAFAHPVRFEAISAAIEAAQSADREPPPEG